MFDFIKNSVELWELATLQSQSVRRNTLYQRSSISWNESSVHLGVISFWLIGFGIAFGEGSPYIGLTNFAGYGLGFRNHAMLFFQVSTIAYRNYGIIIFFHEVKLTNGKNFRFLKSEYVEMMNQTSEHTKFSKSHLNTMFGIIVQRCYQKHVFLALFHS